MRALSRTSLTQRLTLMFALAASSVLLVLGFVIAASVEQHFEDLDMEVLSGKMELTRQALRTMTSHEALTQFTHQLAQSLVGHPGLEVMVIDADHSVVFATGNAHFSPEVVVSQATRAPGRPAFWALGSHTYRGLAAHIPTAALDSSGSPVKVYVAVATDIAQHTTYLRAFLKTLWLFVAAAVALTGVLGWAAVRRGLMPLRTMREQAQVVTAQQLSHRLPVQHMPVELAELAQSLNDMLARLDEAFTRLSDFSSDIAHELRTPVSNLMTQTQVVLSRPRDVAEYRSVLESNAEELERMARMISDMLLLAKAENGLVVPARETVDLAREVRALFEYYEAVADEKNLQLSLSAPSAVPVLADRLMLRRALGNLLSNAIRHANPDSCVRVTLAQASEEVTVTVENVGDTIAPEFLERIFDRFFRVDPSRQHGDGTGLGLAIAKSIIVGHGGTILATSSGAVTKFTIKLPVTPMLTQLTH
ncbi:heavy metal sensor histidine kinase [Rhodoferax sp.]|uniref:heavy metal sensor histidine kinase n=1 Tax=Rhodoferax sp. TaxID=50421 RepID=UPI003BB71F98|nr:heavy metal sensor histidine kinase [Rhodoferax sp.]